MIPLTGCGGKPNGGGGGAAPGGGGGPGGGGAEDGGSGTDAESVGNADPSTGGRGRTPSIGGVAGIDTAVPLC